LFCLSALAGDKSQVIQDSGDGFRVADFVEANHFFYFFARKRFAVMRSSSSGVAGPAVRPSEI